jgi:hypothetical protein
MRPIDANHLSQFFEYGSFESNVRDSILFLINSEPTLDVAPVVHGQWADHPSGGSICSACNRRVPYSHHPKYCESCGAIMDNHKSTSERSDNS